MKGAKGQAFYQLVLFHTTKHAHTRGLSVPSTKLEASSQGGKIYQALHRLTWPLGAGATSAVAQELGRFAATLDFALSIEGCMLLLKTFDEVMNPDGVTQYT